MKKNPIVILPGWLLGSKRFEPLKSVFVKKGYTVHVLDFPGFEEGKELFRPWKLLDYVNFVEGFLRENAIKRAIFIGHSFGGRVALRMLSEKPQIGEALILTGTPGFRSMTSNRLYGIALLAKLGHALLSIPPLSIFQDFMRKLFHILVGARDLSRLQGPMKQTFINIVEEDLENYMKNLAVPTLLLWGKNDTVVKVEIAQKMHHSISGSQLVTVFGAYHNVPYREPEKFAEFTSRFLENKLTPSTV